MQWKRKKKRKSDLIKQVDKSLPCQQLVSPTLPERETTARIRFDFPLSMCEVRHTPRDVFDVNLSNFAGNHDTADSPKCSNYVAERTRKRQNKFTNSFYRFNLIYSSLALDGCTKKKELYLSV